MYKGVPPGNCLHVLHLITVAHPNFYLPNATKNADRRFTFVKKLLSLSSAFEDNITSKVTNGNCHDICEQGLLVILKDSVLVLS